MIHLNKMPQNRSTKPAIIKNATRCPDIDGWERHVDRFLENYADQFLDIFEPSQMYAYGPVSSELKEKIKDFGFTYFNKLGGV